MAETVKTDRRTRQRADTERRLVASASVLFVERGWAATTLSDVADHADVAPRTLYIHFRTKVDLLLRCVDIAIAGDDEPGALADRPVVDEAMSGATLEERLELMASLTASLMERAGALLDVAFQAAPSEPSIAAAAAAGRADTARTLREFWHRLRDDGLLPNWIDLDWLTDTATIITHAETYLLIGRTMDWDRDTYRDWLATTWRRLATSGT
jgi:AcrR family transcriptional regulator